MIESLLFLAIGLILHAYFGYPFTLWIIGRFKTTPDVWHSPQVPSVTLIIPVHNGATTLPSKLENTLKIQYQTNRIEFIVVSDGSTDNTVAIAHSYEHLGVNLINLEQRRGKESAQLEAVRASHGDILVFTDVGTTLDPDGVRNIVKRFSDPSIGCVSSEDRVIGDHGSVSGEGLYVSYEMWLRRLESRANSLVGCSGSFFAAKREVCLDFSSDLQSDFRTVLSCIQKGYRVVVEPTALGYYRDVERGKDEFGRKVRTILRGMTVFFAHIGLLNCFRYGLFSYQVFCHKLMRWLVPALLLIVLITSGILAGYSAIYTSLFIIQILFYGLGVFGVISGIQGSGTILKIPTYFVVVNASIMKAWYDYLSGRRVTLWAPTQRLIE